jgi:hypothetical protein
MQASEQKKALGCTRGCKQSPYTAAIQTRAERGQRDVRSVNVTSWAWTPPTNHAISYQYQALKVATDAHMEEQTTSEP